MKYDAKSKKLISDSSQLTNEMTKPFDRAKLINNSDELVFKFEAPQGKTMAVHMEHNGETMWTKSVPYINDMKVKVGLYAHNYYHDGFLKFAIAAARYDNEKSGVFSTLKTYVAFEHKEI